MSDFRRSSVYSTQPTQQHRRSLGGSLGHRHSRSHSAVRDNLQDIRRHVTTVAQNSQALADKFAEQLRKYKSFAPIFATDGVYAPDGVGGAPALQSIDQILDSRSSFLVRNMTHHRIVHDAAQTTAPPDPRTRLAALDNAVNDIIGTIRSTEDPIAPHPPADGQSRSGFDALDSDGAFAIWLREHPGATPDEQRAEIRRRHQEKIDTERASRSKYLRKWHAELELAIADDAETNRTLAAPVDNQLEVVPPRPPPRRPPAYEVELQRVAWDVFQNGLSTHQASDHHRRSLHAVTGDANEAQSLHYWVEGEWVGHTHRHEAAALCMQCAFRCYCAKKVVHRARYLRQQMQLEQLKSEEEAMYAWKVAVEVMSEERSGRHGKGEDEGLVDKTLAVIHFFIDRMNAKGMRRRAAKDESSLRHFEVASFAAARIQAVFRGHRGRVLVKELRNPEIAKRRTAVLQNGASTIIQATFRRYSTRKRLEQMRHASITIQCCLRRFFAVKRLIALRRTAREAGRNDLIHYAACRLTEFFRSRVAARRRKYAHKLPSIRTLFSVASGYRSRVTLGKARMMAALGLIHRVAVGACTRASIRARLARASREALLVARDVSATDIQRTVRGFLGRRRAKAVRARVSEEQSISRQDDAATTVQSWFRGCKVRSRPSSGAAVQPTPQESASSSTFETTGVQIPVPDAEVLAEATSVAPHSDKFRDDAAKIIQHFYVTHIRLRNVSAVIRKAGRVVTQFMRLAAARSSAAKRGRECRESTHESAAISIQLAVRVYQARMLTAILRARREALYVHVQRDEAAHVVTRFLRYVLTKRKIAVRRQEKSNMNVEDAKVNDL